ncbi:MAG: putative quinol monooxygenase [Gaiellaceae bacterium]
MLALVVRIECPPEGRDRFLEAIAAQAAASLEREPGCLRFDVCSVADDENRFVLYEVYTDMAAYEAHGKTEHFERWSRAAAECGLTIDRTLTELLS